MPTFSGLQCQIRAPAGVLPEYAYLDEEYHHTYKRWEDVPEQETPRHLSNFQSCYIQSTEDQPFLVRFGISQDFFDRFPDAKALVFYITIDGSRHILGSYRCNTPVSVYEITGTITQVPGEKRALRFKTRDNTDEEAVAAGVPNLSSMGRIQVDVHQFDYEKAPRFKSKRVLRQLAGAVFNKDAVRTKALSQKIAKGNDLEHGIELGRAVALRKVNPVSVGVELHPKDTPLASFVFYYRSEGKKARPRTMEE